MDGTTAFSPGDCRVCSVQITSARLACENSWQSVHQVRVGGERCRANTMQIGHWNPSSRALVEHTRGGGWAVTVVRARRRHRRLAGISPVSRTGLLGRRRRIHSASTIAAASIIAGQTGSATIVTGDHLPRHTAPRAGDVRRSNSWKGPTSINITSTSPREMTCSRRYRLPIPEQADLFKYLLRRRGIEAPVGQRHWWHLCCSFRSPGRPAGCGERGGPDSVPAGDDPAHQAWPATVAAREPKVRSRPR